MKKLIQKYCAKTEGGVTVEFVMFLPVFLAFFVFSFASFNVLMNKATTVKASYTSGDLISRRTTLDNAYLDQIHDVFQSITRANPADTWMRITSITQDTDAVIVDWSYVTGTSADQGVALDENASQWNDDLPDLVVGETVIFVETYRTYTPGLSVVFFPMSALMKVRTFSNKQIVPLRFTEQLINSDYPLAFSNNVHNDGNGGVE